MLDISISNHQTTTWAINVSPELGETIQQFSRDQKDLEARLLKDTTKTKSARRLAAAGLQPLGENGSWFQRIPFEEISVADATLRGSGGDLVFLDHFTVVPNLGLPSKLTAPVAYRGYCAPDVLENVAGKLVICHGTHRSGLPNRAEREAAVRKAGAAGIATIADPGFSLEPPRWPYAHARTVKRRGELPEADPIVEITLNADTLHLLLGRDTEDLVTLGAAGQTLPLFDSGTAEMSFVTRTARYSSPNVIGLLPGTNPSFSDQAIVILSLIHI